MFSSKPSSKGSSSKGSSSKGSTSTLDYFAVYLAKFKLGVNDPGLPGPRYHHVVYVETEPGESGVKFHVIGDITSKGGMKYESKSCRKPQRSASFSEAELLGYTPAKGFQHHWDEVLGRLPTPPKQKEYNMKTNKTELVKSWDPLTFYKPGEQRHLPWKCTEWTNDYAIPALYEAGLIIAAQDANNNAGSAAKSVESGDWLWDEKHRRYRRWSHGTKSWVWAPEH